MIEVIDEPKRNHLELSYVDFLRFLFNEVNFPLEESVELLNWKKDILGGNKYPFVVPMLSYLHLFY